MIQNHFVDEPTGNSKTALLCGGLSQEMYQALAAIQTAAGCLKQEIHRSANEQMIQRTQWMLDHVHQGTLQLYRIAENLEDMLAAEQGTLLPQLEPVELVSQYEQLIELLRTACANQGIQLEWHCQVEEYPVFLNCDGGWADKILLNVVSNAVLASTSGQTVWVEVRFAKNSQRSDTLEIVVRDEGPGLPQEVQNHLYEVFVNRYQSSENCVSYGAGLNGPRSDYFKISSISPSKLGVRTPFPTLARNSSTVQKRPPSSSSLGRISPSQHVRKTCTSSYSRSERKS